MNEEPKKIWPVAEVFYLHSILFNTKSALESVDKLDVAFESLGQDITIEDIRALNFSQILDQFQNIVLQAAALSRYFWPTRRNHDWRGEQLRQAFGLSDDSLLKSRDLRNSIEHFDERLDKCFENQVVGFVMPEYVGPTPNDSDVPGHIFRGYYIDKGEFHLLGERYLIGPIIDAVQQVHEQILAFDQNGGRLGSKTKFDP